MRKFLIVPPLSTVLLLGSLWAQDATPRQQPADQNSQAAPDNTAKNQRDRNQSEATADQQKENKSDLELARQIRQALVKDKHLKLQLVRGRQRFNAIWFNHVDTLPARAMVAYRLVSDTWNGVARVQMVVEHAAG